GLLADIGEVPVAVVVEQEIGLARQAARSALHRDATVLAGLVLTELRKVIEIDLDVAADEQIQIAIPIVISEAAARRPSARCNAGLFGNVGKRPIVIVSIEAVFAE